MAKKKSNQVPDNGAKEHRIRVAHEGSFVKSDLKQTLRQARADLRVFKRHGVRCWVGPA